MIFTSLIEKLIYFAKKNKTLGKEGVISRSIFFDPSYYEKNHPDIAKTGLSPIEFYMKIGILKNHNPSQCFSAEFYKTANPEYLLSTNNPLKHYLLEGGKTYGALICPVIEKPKQNNNIVNKQFAYHYKQNKYLKVAFFSHNLNLEGAPIVCKDIAIAMQKSEFISSTVFSPVDGVLRKQLESKGIKVVIYKTFDKNKISSAIQFKNFIKSFAQTLENYNFDTIYANTILSFWLILVAKQLNKPSIFHVHESEPINYHVQSKSFDFSPFIIDALSLAQYVVFVANNTLNKYQPYQQKNNFQVIKNAFDSSEIPTIKQPAQHLRRHLGIKKNQLMFLTVGSIANRKGQIDIINALDILDESIFTNSYFVLVGDVNTSYSQYLHKRVKKLSRKLSAKVLFIKKTQHVFDYYNAADACIFTSRIESYPKVIQEAMYYRLPIITTPVDGISEQLKDQYSGVFYQAGDANALAKLITTISTDKILRKKLGKNAYLTLKTMISPEEMMTRYFKLFQTRGNKPL